MLGCFFGSGDRGGDDGPEFGGSVFAGVVGVGRAEAGEAEAEAEDEDEDGEAGITGD